MTGLSCGLMCTWETLLVLVTMTHFLLSFFYLLMRRKKGLLYLLTCQNSVFSIGFTK